MIPAIFHIAIMLALALLFTHFMHGGARTFVLPEDSEGGGAGIGQLTFTAGALITLFAGMYYRIQIYNGIAAGVLAVCGGGLYEWARQTIVGRRFHVGLSQGVPEELCEAGPYAYVRHPIYIGYLLAFLALFVAFPKIITGIALVLNVALFLRMANHDERVLAASPLAEAYAEYKKRVGRFFPRLA